MAVTPTGAAWAVPLTQADPLLLTYGRPVSACAARSQSSGGALHLPVGAGAAGEAGGAHVAPRALRLVWGDPSRGAARSHVPGFLVVDDAGAALVDVGQQRHGETARRAAADAVREVGWRAEVYAGPGWDRHGVALADAALAAPPGWVSGGLLAAAAARLPGAALLDQVLTSGDLLSLLPVLRAARAPVVAARQAVAG